MTNLATLFTEAQHAILAARQHAIFSNAAAADGAKQQMRSMQGTAHLRGHVVELACHNQNTAASEANHADTGLCDVCFA